MKNKVYKNISVCFGGFQIKFKFKLHLYIILFKIIIKKPRNTYGKNSIEINKLCKIR